MRSIPPELLDELTIVAQRIRCGETLEQAVQERTKLHVPHTLALEWIELYDHVKCGEWAALNALEYYLKGLKTEHRCFSLYRKKSLTPMVEMWVISILLVVLNVFTYWQFPAPLNQSLPLVLIILSSILLAFLCAHLIQKRFSRILSTLGWNQFLQRLCFHLRMGRSFPMSLKTALQLECPHLSSVTLNTLQEDFIKIASGQADSITHPENNIKATFEDLQWRSILKNYLRGTPLLEITEAFISHNADHLMDQIERNGERLGFWMLVPVFCFLIPAFFVTLGRPLWSLFQDF